MRTSRIVFGSHPIFALLNEINNGYQTEHDEMYAAIRYGKPLNTGDRMITTTLTAIMARMAAYTGKKVTKEMALDSKEQLVPDADKLTWDLDFQPKPPRKAGTDDAIAPHKWKV